MVQPLFAPEISLGSLNRRMSQKELDLLQFSSRQMAESRTCTAEIVRRESLDSGRAPRRGSRPVLREAGGEIPPAYSPGVNTLLV
jgi:hypothetical protein